MAPPKNLIRIMEIPIATTLAQMGTGHPREQTT